MAFLTDLIGSKTGKSHKRFIALLFSIVIVIISGVLLVVEIPENNVAIFNQILYIFGGVILFQTGASVYEKKKKVDEKENNTENIE